jgi:hypothetical protein
MAQHRKYNILTGSYTQTTRVQVVKNCNGWVAINKGNVEVRVQGLPLLPAAVAGTSGESYGVSGNNDEIYSGDIDVEFPIAGGQVYIIQKYFID